MVRASGFEVEYLTYFFPFLSLPVPLFRSLPYRLRRNLQPTSDTAQREHAAQGGRGGKVPARLLTRELR